MYVCIAECVEKAKALIMVLNFIVKSYLARTDFFPFPPVRIVHYPSWYLGDVSVLYAKDHALKKNEM